MKLVTFDAGSGPKPGVLRGDEVIDLSPVVASILALVQGPSSLWAEAEAAAATSSACADVNTVRLLAPIHEPQRHLYCVGWNYPKHYEEGIGKRERQEVDERTFPTFFTKPPLSVIGPTAPIAWDRELTERLDYEGELAIVLGRTGRSIPEHDAMSYVFGYTLANDVSARDIQRRHGGQWLKGKGMDTYCPMGPAVVTAGGLDHTALQLRVLVNGDPRQEDSTGHMIFSLEHIISALSLGMTLFAGDIILTGTPAGVGFARNPETFLVPGDVVEVTIPEIGSLRNPVQEMSLTANHAPAAVSRGR